MNSKNRAAPLATRRAFLKTAVSAVGVTLAPLVVPARVLGRDGGVAPSNRVVLGGIGIGNRGRQVLEVMMAEKDVQFVATCDVQARLRQSVKAMVDETYANKDCATYRDMRELLSRPDIDAVIIAAGDRWQALGPILAAKAGKDVYGEKPCGLSIGECQALSDVIRSTGRVFQAGTQRRNVPNYQFAVHLAHSGKLGRLHTLHGGILKLGRLHEWLPAEPEPMKNEVDWDLFLGPAGWRPYNAAYVAGRKWKNYHGFISGANLLEHGAHSIDICQWANQADNTAPIEYEPEGGAIHARYANGVKLEFRPAGWIGQRGQTSGDGEYGSTGTCPIRFEGDEGWVETGGYGAIELHPASLRNEWQSFTMRGTDPSLHTREFLDCVKSRRLPAANHNVMRHSHIACHAASIAWQLGRKVDFDPVKEEFVGDDEANRMRSRALRQPWHV
ncbi:MAG: Gfo/Idh/MocA family oxidoreductase [Opitutaceae bacterium]|nr:Gfo/Idh/MocA family oxidoreductase [Opitutaceae bacterium]